MLPVDVAARYEGDAAVACDLIEGGNSYVVWRGFPVAGLATDSLAEHLDEIVLVTENDVRRTLVELVTLDRIVAEAAGAVTSSHSPARAESSRQSKCRGGDA